MATESDARTTLRTGSDRRSRRTGEEAMHYSDFFNIHFYTSRSAVLAVLTDMICSACGILLCTNYVRTSLMQTVVMCNFAINESEENT